MKQFYLIIAGLCATFAAKAQSNPTISVSIEVPMPVCEVGGCTVLQAQYTPLNQATGYTVQATSFSPIFPTTGGNTINATADDVWSPLFNLPFDFSFYGNTYNQILIGSNGVITFDTTTFTPLGGCPWAFNATIPNAGFPIKNAIYGVYQDSDISGAALNDDAIPNAIQNVNYYVLDTGDNAAPNRVFVANFNELPHYQCHATAGTQTTQIVLHEGTNIIDILVYKRTPCTSWNGGAGVIGIQNATGTAAVTPAGRNTGSWSANNEAWRFTPNGVAVPTTLTWLANGEPIGTENPITVCVDEGTNFTAVVDYNDHYTASASVDVAPVFYAIEEPQDLILCTDEPGPYTFDLTAVGTQMLAAETPANFSVNYYANYQDAVDLAPNNIQGPATYAAAASQTLYVSIEDLMFFGCVIVKPFQLEINPAAAPPTGSATQTFTSGQTLANLVVTGQNIQWYATATSTEVLPASTPLADGATYFASQTIGDCESRALPNRLAVTVSQVLSRDAFVLQAFRLAPNPAAQTVGISAPSAMTSILVYNLLGQKVLDKPASGHEATLDVSNLEAGSYLVKVTADGATTSGRLIKK